MPSQLAAAVRAKYPGAYDGVDDATLEKAIVAKHPEYAHMAEPPAEQKQPDLGRFGGVKRIGDAAMNVMKHPDVIPSALAAAAGAVGQAAPGPLKMIGIPMALIAGASGAGMRGMLRIADQPPSSPGDMITRMKSVGGEMLAEGGKQAGLQAAGQYVAGPIASRGARILMDNAVRPTAKVLSEFPNVVETLVKERLPVGRLLGRSGSQQAKAALRESAGTTRGLLSQADAAGAQIQPKQVMSELPALRADAAKSTGLPGGGTNGLADMEAEFAATHQTPMSASETKDLKRAAQSLAKPVFRAQRQGHVVGADQSMAARYNDAIAGGSRQGLEDIPQFGKQIGASEQRTQDLIGATQALRGAEARRLPLWAELASTAAGSAAGAYSGDTKKGLGTALAIRALSSPRTLSRAALSLDWATPLAEQAPRLAALIAALTGTNGPQP